MRTQVHAWNTVMNPANIGNDDISIQVIVLPTHHSFFLFSSIFLFCLCFIAKGQIHTDIMCWWFTCLDTPTMCQIWVLLLSHVWSDNRHWSIDADCIKSSTITWSGLGKFSTQYTPHHNCTLLCWPVTKERIAVQCQ